MPPSRPLPARPVHRSEPLQQACAQLNQIVADLRDVLADLEDVAELLEIAETQKLDDEKEVEALRRTLNQLQRVRDRGHVRPQHQPQALQTSGSPNQLPLRQ
jgi:CHASE3 domain sensor protein